MKKYIPANKALDLSAALFSLSRPSSVTRPGEVTSWLSAVETDLSGGSWIVLESTRRLRVHPQASLDGITTLVSPLIAAGVLAPNTLEILQRKLDDSYGGYINVFEALPDEIKAASKERAQLVELGLLNPPPNVP